jgi:hypothetical protein
MRGGSRLPEDRRGLLLLRCSQNVTVSRCVCGSGAKSEVGHRERIYELTQGDLPRTSGKPEAW